MRKQLVQTTMVMITLLAVAAACAPQGETVLTVSGAVDNTLELTQADLEDLGVEELTLEHPRNGAQPYEGVRLSAILGEASANGTMVKFVASDGYEYEIAVADLDACEDCIVAITDEGLNLAMPGMEGKAWVKDIVTIEVQ